MAKNTSVKATRVKNISSKEKGSVKKQSAEIPELVKNRKLLKAIELHKASLQKAKSTLKDLKKQLNVVSKSLKSAKNVASNTKQQSMKLSTKAAKSALNKARSEVKQWTAKSTKLRCGYPTTT